MVGQHGGAVEGGAAVAGNQPGILVENRSVCLGRRDGLAILPWPIGGAGARCAASSAVDRRATQIVQRGHTWYRFATRPTCQAHAIPHIDGRFRRGRGVRAGLCRPRLGADRCRHVNGDYAGLYVIIEEVDEFLVSRFFGHVDHAGQDGGSLFEFNYTTSVPWRFDYLGPKLAPYKDRFDIKDKHGRADDAIWGPVETLTRLASETSPDAFADTIKAHLDLEAFMRYVAAQNFVAQHDGLLGYAGANNFYLYRRSGGSHVFIAWDEDNAFASPDFALDTRHDENVVMRKLMAQDALRARYYGLLQTAAAAAAEVTPGRPDGWLRGEIKAQLDLIARAKYDDLQSPFSSHEQFAAQELMLGFPAARVRFVACQLARQSGTPAAGCQ